jgi:hypothetical protein
MDQVVEVAIAPEAVIEPPRPRKRNEEPVENPAED